MQDRFYKIRGIGFSPVWARYWEPGVSGERTQSRDNEKVNKPVRQKHLFRGTTSFRTEQLQLPELELPL